MNIIQTLHQYDVNAFLWLNLKKRNEYRKIIRAISRTGDGYVYVVAGILAWFSGSEAGATFLVVGIMAYGTEVGIYLLAKNTIRRSRPTEVPSLSYAWVVPSDRFSFPSGHTAAAFVFVSLCFVYFPLVVLLVLPWACLVGVSRVLLGVHYPTDILAGAGLGVASCFAAIQFHTQLPL